MGTIVGDFPAEAARPGQAIDGEFSWRSRRSCIAGEFSAVSPMEI